jgi:serine/threonine-protein kinase
VSESLPRRDEGPYADEVTGVEPLIVGNKFRMARQLCVHDDEQVYEAIHTGTERRVRVHMLSRKEPAKSALAERMRRAARAAGRVPHPHVLGVVDSGVDQGKPFLVYEYFGSVSLADWIEREGPQPMDVAARVICQVLDALSALHRGGVVHRSIKPENVLIERNGAELRSKLTGFGWAVVQGKFDDAPALSRGFSRYMAPEARRDAHASGPLLDLYAVGALMRFLLTGDPALPCNDARAERAIARACAEEPTERFPTAEPFLSTVAALMPDAAGGAPPAGSSCATRSRRSRTCCRAPAMARVTVAKACRRSWW